MEPEENTQLEKDLLEKIKKDILEKLENDEQNTPHWERDSWKSISGYAVVKAINEREDIEIQEKEGLVEKLIALLPKSENDFLRESGKTPRGDHYGSVVDAGMIR